MHSYTDLLKNVSIAIGAFFLLLFPACKAEKQTPDWEQKELPSHNVSTEKTAKPLVSKSSTEVRFLAYNLKNYLTMRRYKDGKSSRRPKPEREITELIKIIQSTHPDVLGVCEIGSDKDLSDLKNRLKKAGVDLPYTHRTFGSDYTRSLAILSKYEIKSWSQPKKMDYTLNGTKFKISRGILDVTLALPQKNVRFLGVHLKSKRPVRGADQELMRRNEALLFRQHVDSILTKKPDTLLLAYGDFNDTKRQKSIHTCRGRSHGKRSLEILNIKDSRDENWTHNWKNEDIYSRFDFVMTNKNLTPYIKKKECKILDPKDWYQASDHRALLVIIK